MLHAIDYHAATGNINGGEHHSLPLPPIPANHTRLLASDWAHLDEYRETGELAPLNDTDVIPVRVLVRQGVVVEYERRRDALPRPEAIPVPEPVPATVSNQQLRLALIDAGIMPSAILAQLQAMPAGAAKERALAAWEYANEFRRDHPLVTALSAQLGLTSAQVDSLFRAAATLG